MRSAMQISRAWTLLPQGIYVRPRFDLYEEYSRRIMAALRGFVGIPTPGTDPSTQSPVALFEQSSIDEAVLDCTRLLEPCGDPGAVARGIQAAVSSAVSVGCSVGIASGKVTAKIACETRKPAGVTIVLPGTEREFLAPLAASRIPGIGPKTAAALEKKGVSTIAHLAAAEPAILRRMLGRSSGYFLRIARGEDDSGPAGGWEAKSLSEEHTFDEDVAARSEVAEVLAGMAGRLSGQLSERGLSARNVTIKIRFAGFDTRTLSRTLPAPVGDEVSIGRAAVDLLGRLSGDRRRVRLAGLRVSDLRKSGARRGLETWSSAGEVSHLSEERRSRSDRWRF